MRTSSFAQPRVCGRGAARRRSTALLLGALLGASATAAHASSSYPEKLSSVLDLQCAPRCTLCHRDDSGGIGTVITPFGDNMYGRGLLDGRAPSTIPEALRRMENVAEEDFDGDGFPDDPIDSDDDGMNDVEELRQGRDPNFAGAGVLCGPQYGCGATVTPPGAVSGTTAGAAALAVVAGLALLGRLRSRTTARR